ncbi:MAG: Hsp70 family protein [Chloroflexota bacterium]|nr:Hsp70 family protein [Chloroflexota bacterium]
MTKIVGVDFGTANVRIAQWDVEAVGRPTNCIIGTTVNPSVMPAVIAFERQRDGVVIHKVGEEADDFRDDRDDVQVVRNIKRYALMSDEYVRRQYDEDVVQQRKAWPKWFDQDTGSIRLWNETISVEKAIQLILKEAIAKSGLAGQVAEWRAGCPVESNLAYRRALVSALADLGCTGKVEWISQEPLLLLALGKELDSLTDGYYLVYDLGGGSFDCTAAEVRDNQITVLAEGGLSALGGMDIDDKLVERLPFAGRVQELRIAKERLTPENETLPLEGGLVLTNADVSEVLEDLKLMDQTLDAMANAFEKAQIVRGEIAGNVSDLRKRMDRYESIETMSSEVDKVLVVGGPTRMPYFKDKLEDVFGAGKVVTADELTQSEDRADFDDPTLTALSRGACYIQDKVYIPRVVDRVPAQISLTVSDYHTTEVDIREPFERFSRQSLGSFEGREIIRRVLYDFEQTQLEGNRRAIYWVTVRSPDGEVIFRSNSLEMEMPREGYTGPRADRISLIIDPLGGVKVRLRAGRRPFDRRDSLDPRHNEIESVLDVFSDPPWQPAVEPREPDTKKGRVELRNGELFFIWG